MTRRTWLSVDDCFVEDLAAVTAAGTSLADYPWAAQVVDDVLMYSAAALRPAMTDPEGRRVLQEELVRALLDGPGVIVLSGAYPDTDVVDAVSGVFDDIIHEQRATGGPAGDHFGAPGANDRIWNALEKLAVRAPDCFLPYYANDVVALVAEAWLGPAYQITSQVNAVNPGGAAQQAHRDYHLGFQSNETAAKFPAHAHALSPVLTLQGAVAHTDMPVESGPTLYLPHSQKYAYGYLASRLPQFRAHFDEHRVQVSLFKGDVVFFNPALFHAAGENTTRTVRRMANLLQISSPMGRAMESIDRQRLVLAVYDELLAACHSGDWEPRDIANVVAATAEGYAFPTNLDLDQPVDALAPPTQAQLLTQALTEKWSHDALAARLAEQVARQRP